MDSIRQNKVARLIQRDLSEMFQQECKEYTEGAMLSVTAVRVSPDLSYAKIYVSIFPSERVEAVMKSLEEKNKSIRFILGKKVGQTNAASCRNFVSLSMTAWTISTKSTNY